MKNNFHIKTKAFEVQGIKIPAFEISVKSDYTLDEVKGVKQIMQEFLKELPGMVEDIKAFADKMDELTGVPTEAEEYHSEEEKQEPFQNVSVLKTEVVPKEEVTEKKENIISSHAKRLLGK